MKRNKREQPPLEYRMVFVQFVRRQRSRYNPSLSRLLELPATFRNQIVSEYQQRHPRMVLPELELSVPRKGRKR